jgi:hypothetical protein
MPSAHARTVRGQQRVSASMDLPAAAISNGWATVSFARVVGQLPIFYNRKPAAR